MDSNIWKQCYYHTRMDVLKILLSAGTFVDKRDSDIYADRKELELWEWIKYRSGNEEGYPRERGMHDQSINFTPLMMCVITCDYDLMKLLIENGANLDARDVYGRTALGIAAEEYSGVALDLLLRARYKISEAEQDTEEKRENIIQLLLNNGVDPGFVYGHMTALDYTLDVLKDCGPIVV